MSGGDWTKRSFLQALGASLPVLKLALGGAAVSDGSLAATPVDENKFTTLDCSAHFNASAAEVEHEPRLETPSGSQRFRGIPFSLGPHDTASMKKWIALARSGPSWTAKGVELPVGKAATYLCLAQFCRPDPNERPEPGSQALEKVGQELARLTLAYEDGTKHVHPIRRRFEVNSLQVPWGHLCFAAVAHRQDVPQGLTDRLGNAMEWGDLQMTAFSGDYPGSSDDKSTLWISAIENPYPLRAIKTLQFEATVDDPLFVCGVSLFHGKDHPLRYERLMPLRVDLPAGLVYDPDRWSADVDLGVIARMYGEADFQPREWLSSPTAGLGAVPRDDHPAHFMIELSASRDATLTVTDKNSGQIFIFPMRGVYEPPERGAANGATRVEFLDAHKTWMHGRVTDQTTGKATPVRIAFRSSDGRYIPPYGHRTEVNAGWFQDYGADIKMGGSSFAYVDGTFQIELPVGEVYVEISKGFEYAPVRKQLHIEPGQRELNLDIAPFFDLRSKSWVSADTHVHFLSPSTAILEGEAEGLNLINLLAAQWGDLFTNVGDLPYGPLSSKDGNMLVCPGTENRQHILGHLGLLGTHAHPVFPMSASGPEEGYLGNPLWRGLCEWADACREGGGLAVAAHFPYPTAELAAAIALNKIDAVELWPQEMSEQFNNRRFQDWYQYLNCGYRLPAVSGTDKMGAWIPAGAYRAYAHLGAEEFTFANWAKAVRAGNTFMSSGPLMLFEVDGHVPGAELAVGKSGGSLQVRAEARSAVPIHLLEIVANGRVVASRSEGKGAREIVLRDEIRTEAPGWIAARCASRLATPGYRVAAHTSPVYLTVPGMELFSAPVAAYMLTLIEGAEMWSATLATRPDPDQFQRVLQGFKDARRRIHARMHQHSASA